MGVHMRGRGLGRRWAVMALLVAVLLPSCRRDQQQAVPAGAEAAAPQGGAPPSGAPLQSGEPGKLRGDEALVLTFPALSELEPVWAVDPNGFPPYVEVAVSFTQAGRKRLELIGLDLKNIREAKLHREPQPPVVADLAEDFCQQGIAHLSVWVTAPDVADLSFTLYGYRQVQDKDRKGLGNYDIQLALKNPPGYEGPVVHKLEARYFAGNRLYATLSGSEVVRPAGYPNLDAVRRAIDLQQGEARVVDLPVAPDFPLTFDTADTRRQAVKVSPRESDVVSLAITAQNDLVVTGRAPGEQVVSLLLEGVPESTFTIRVAAGETGTPPPATVGALRYGVGAAADADVPLPRGSQGGAVPGAQGWSVNRGRLQGAVDQGPVTLMVPQKDGGRAMVSVFPTQGAPKVRIERVAGLPQPPLMVDLGPTGPLVVNHDGVEAVGRRVWSLKPGKRIHLAASSADRLALVVADSEVLVSRSTVLVYQLIDGADPVALGAMLTEPWPQIMRWRGTELWMAHRDGRVTQALPEGDGFTTRVVQSDARKATPMDMMVDPDGRVMVVSDERLDVYDGEGAKAGAVAAHTLASCPAHRIAHVNQNRFVVGCGGVRRTGEKYGVYNYEMAPGAHLMEITLKGNSLSARTLRFGDPPGIIHLLTPWPGGYLVGASNDTSRQVVAETGTPPDRGQVVVVGADGGVAAKAVVPLAIQDPGRPVAPWEGGVFVAFDDTGLYKLIPR